MLSHTLASALAIALTATLALARACREKVLSCPVPSGADACCVLGPGVVVFKQRFDPEVGDGHWGIEGLDLYKCNGEPAPTSKPLSPALTHEQVASVVLRRGVAHEQAEREWAQSEVGEGWEEVWERSWNAAGRHISTLGPECVENGEGVPLFFEALSRLHARYDTATLLADADIVPSADTTYTLGEVIAALRRTDPLGVTPDPEHPEHPYVTCDNTTLSTVHWPLLVRGTFHDGEFEPAEVALAVSGSTSRCPEQGIQYLPSQVPPPKASDTARWDAIYRPPMRPITKSHDESRLYRASDAAQAPEPEANKLGFFKKRDEVREAEPVERRFRRDEL